MDSWQRIYDVTESYSLNQEEHPSMYVRNDEVIGILLYEIFH